MNISRDAASRGRMPPPSSANGLPNSLQEQRTLAGRYKILSRLGEGGMGEVWHAHDLKLRIDVALKSIRFDGEQQADPLEALRREVRTARSVISPNVCRVFDLVVEDRQELISMEYIDGITLMALLIQKGPLQLSEARDIAAQFLAGLDAIHKAGFVHCDLKPENIMITRTGRVVVMDFGVARQAIQKDATVSGTLPYMAPERLAGSEIDARTDLYSAGVILAEMIHPQKILSKQTREEIWNAVQNDPLQLAETPWKPTILRSIAPSPKDRFPSAGALARALEEATPRSSAGEEQRPYPGLSPFTAGDAGYFFGRELEVETLIKKLQQAHLSALIGPSGTGKTSFLRAGLIPALPDGWNVIFCVPGDAPLLNLGRALIPAIPRDTDAMQKFLQFEDPLAALELLHRWRAKHPEVLLIVDRFEELFTLNRPEVQSRFAELIAGAALDADVRVLLCLRDDFLFRCHETPCLDPIFSALTPLGALSGPSLRRALVSPALSCGYSFEDETLVDDILIEVEKERGALPLMAFCALRLWQKRERASGQLTRKAYEEIGGVGGALALHAEETMAHIGETREPIVREIFRNLVTAESTRIARDIDEILSVFSEKNAAEEVLRNLIDARLLTSYESPGAEGEKPKGRVEIIHESLLSAWPRLVRWQTQDADGAQLRDQLRQAAHLWIQKGRTTDLLWTGTAYREFELWRERYPGALTTNEEDFARGMRDREHRRKRLFRATVISVFAALCGIAIAIGVSRSQAAKARDEAKAEAARAEAGKLLSIGRLKLEDSPSAALAYAIASLERSDNDAARRFAVEALWHGPALFLTDKSFPTGITWSPDERWLFLGKVLLERGSNERRQITNVEQVTIGFTRDGRRLVTRDRSAKRAVVHVWSLPGARLERTLDQGAPASVFLLNDQLLSLTFDQSAPLGQRRGTFRRISLDGKTQDVPGRWNPRDLIDRDVDPDGAIIVSNQGGEIIQQKLDQLSAPGRVLGVHKGAGVWIRPWRNRAVTGDSAGEVRVWDLQSGRLERTLKSPASAHVLALSPGGRFIASCPGGASSLHSAFLLDLAAPATAEPTPLLGFEVPWLGGIYFSPDGKWIAGDANGEVEVLWSTASAHSTVLSRGSGSDEVFFTPDGRLLSVANTDGVLRILPTSAAADAEVRQLWSQPGVLVLVTPDPRGRFVAVEGLKKGEVNIVPFDGSRAVVLPLKQFEGAQVMTLLGSLDPAGRFLAMTLLDHGAIRILDLTTGDETTLDSRPSGKDHCEETGGGFDGFAVPLWLDDGRLISDGDAGLRVWDLKAGTSERLRPCRKISDITGVKLLATSDSRLVLRLDLALQPGSASSLSVFDLVSHTTRQITSHGNRISSFAIDPSGKSLLTGDMNGVIRVGPISGQEPHLLFGHTGAVRSIAVSPDGRTIASAGEDGTIRLWPMPDLSKPPMHTLPYKELLANLKSLTNLRTVPDPSSDTGWKTEIGPFPGWAVVPDWHP